MKTQTNCLLLFFTAIAFFPSSGNADTIVFIDDPHWTIPSSGIPEIHLTMSFTTNERVSFDWDVIADIELSDMEPVGNDFAVDFRLTVMNFDESGLDSSVWDFDGQALGLPNFQWDLLDVQGAPANTTDFYRFLADNPAPEEQNGYFSNPPEWTGGVTNEGLLWNGFLPTDVPANEAVFHARILVDPSDNFTSEHFTGDTLILPMRFSTSVPEPGPFTSLVGMSLLLFRRRR